MRYWTTFFLWALCARLALADVGATGSAISWQPWSQAAFDQARQQHKLVLVDVEAVWCHWCHVQDKMTYHDPGVVNEIDKHYVAIKVDQDARPDLSNRYEDYGWPATVLLKPDGTELVKFAGYIPPLRMRSLLQATVKDPTPGPSIVREPTPHFSTQGTLSDRVRQETINRYKARYDEKLGGWGDAQKFLDWDCVEYAMDHGLDTMARQTLDAQLQLIDPVWGGVCQYSDGGVWTNPHYEKIMVMQANDLRIYSLAWSRYHDERYRHAAQQIHGYLVHFLRDDNGAFYTSQDADLVADRESRHYYSLSDGERRKLGVPRIDKHQYARENGLAIQALAVYYEMTGDESAKGEALQAAGWVMEHRTLPGGGFAHDEHDVAGPYLADTLSMGEAFLALYEATADRTWLDRSRTAAAFIRQRFAGHPGFPTAANGRPETDENLRLARWANLLYQDTGDADLHSMSQQAMRYMAAPEVARESDSGGLLLTDSELGREPTHISITGEGDERAALLYRIAVTFPSLYRRIEWLKPGQEPLRKDVEYPTLAQPAAFLCTGDRCSTPAFDVASLQQRMERALSR